MKPLKNKAKINLRTCEMLLHPSDETKPANTRRSTNTISSRANHWDIDGNNCPEIELGRVLGSGGFGQVFEAKWYGKKVAVKQLTLKSKLRNRNAPEETLKAESLLLEYTHRNLVEVLGVFSGESIDDCFVIMEFAGERNLQAVIDDEFVDLTESLRVRIALDITSGLEFMHERGLAHLDIKPANIIVNKDFECKICDFGCCQYVELSDTKDYHPPSPTNSSLAGTYTYRAPELLKGGFPTTKADIYSLAVCLWQLCVREQPYGRESHFVIIFGVVQKGLRPQFPQEVILNSQNTMYINLTSSMWHPDLSERPTAKQLVKILKNWHNL